MTVVESTNFLKISKPPDEHNRQNIHQCWNLKILVRTLGDFDSCGIMATSAASSTNSFDRWLSNFEFSQGVQHAFEVAQHLPPLTYKALEPIKLLGGPLMQPAYRYDINFDLGVHFRSGHDATEHHPEIDRVTLDKAKSRYWLAIQYEVEAYSFVNRSQERFKFSREDQKSSKLWRLGRLERMFEEIQDLIVELMPTRGDDVQDVPSIMDPPLRMQELRNGVAPDFSALADWLHETLKRRCSPVRDGLNDRAADRLRSMTHSGEAVNFARAMDDLFALLQAMHLDCANHATKSIRYAVCLPAHWRYFHAHWAKLIDEDILDSSVCEGWYREGISGTSELTTSEHFEQFVKRCTDCLFNCIPDQSSRSSFPASWELEIHHLDRLIGHIEMLTGVEICVTHLIGLLANDDSTPKARVAETAVRTALPSIVEGSGWQEMAGYIAGEVIQAATTYYEEKTGKTSTLPPRQQSAEQDIIQWSSQESRETRKSIPASWMARLHSMEQTLKRDLDPHGQVFKDHLNLIRTHVLHGLQSSFKARIGDEPWQLSNRFVGETPPPTAAMGGYWYPQTWSSTQRLQAGKPILQDVIDRLTHILCLHWGWAGLLIYAGDASGMLDSRTDPKMVSTFDINEALEDFPILNWIIYGGPGAEEGLAAAGYTGQVVMAGSPDETSYHRYSTGKVSKSRRLPGSGEDQENQEALREEAEKLRSVNLRTAPGPA